MSLDMGFHLGTFLAFAEDNVSRFATQSFEQDGPFGFSHCSLPLDLTRHATRDCKVRIGPAFCVL